MTKDKFKTRANVFDAFTERNLFVLSSKGFFEETTMSPLSIGKEANVFTAQGKEGHVIIKIFRLETADFTRMYEYIRTDPRYENLKHRRREIIFAWAQREYRNLMKARDAHVAAPIPIEILKNIIIMEQIGDPAPKMKDQIPEKPEQFYKAVVDNMHKLLKAGYAHGDLSGFNILNDQEDPVFIDFSQATSMRDPKGKELLERDAKNIATFFQKLKVDTSKEEILKKVYAE